MPHPLLIREHVQQNSTRIRDRDCPVAEVEVAAGERTDPSLQVRLVRKDLKRSWRSRPAEYVGKFARPKPTLRTRIGIIERPVGMRRLLSEPLEARVETGNDRLITKGEPAIRAAAIKRRPVETGHGREPPHSR